MPGPSSAISTRTSSPRPRVVIVMVPPPSIASTAFVSRFVHTWFSSDPCTVTGGSVRS